MPDFASPRSRRLILAALVSAALAVPILKATRASAADKGPIRIGFLTVKTGALAAGGRQMEEGLALYLDQHQGQLAGRKIEVVTLDTAGQPATTDVYMGNSQGVQQAMKPNALKPIDWNAVVDKPVPGEQGFDQRVTC